MDQVKSRIFMRNSKIILSEMPWIPLKSQETSGVSSVHPGWHNFSSTKCPNNSHTLEISEDPCWKVKKVWVVGVLAGGETVRFMKEIKGCWGASRAGGEGTFAKMQWLNVVWLASKAKPNQKYFFLVSTEGKINQAKSNQTASTYAQQPRLIISIEFSLNF